MEEQIAGGENTDFVEIAGGDQVKMARLMEIHSWFNNIRQLDWTAMATLREMTSREKRKIFFPARTTEAQDQDPPMGDGVGQFVQPVGQA